MKSRIPFALGLLVAGGTALAQEPQPVGDQFQVNTYTTSWQDNGAVAAADGGDFVVVWTSYGSYGTDDFYQSIQGQRFDSSGTPAGGEFQVNSNTISLQINPGVAADSVGNFVVVWESRFSDGTDLGWSIQGQRYDASGSKVDGQFQINTYTTDEQRTPAVAVDADGDFVVVWTNGYYFDFWSIQGQLYDASGMLVGDEFQVNSYSTDSLGAPAVAMDADGDFVVVWSSTGSPGTDTSSSSVQAQRYDASGASVGGQFQVNSYTTNFQGDPAVAVDSDGDFVVAWTSYGSFGTDSSNQSIQGQRFESSGIPVGGEFQVNSYSTDSQGSGAVAIDDEGEFVVVWQSDGSGATDTDSWSIQGQRYDASGAAVGGQFQVNTFTTSDQKYPAATSDEQGDFVVVWNSYGSYGTDASSYSIQGQRFSTVMVFADGFESGNTSGWTGSVP